MLIYCYIDDVGLEDNRLYRKWFVQASLENTYLKTHLTSALNLASDFAGYGPSECKKEVNELREKIKKDGIEL